MKKLLQRIPSAKSKRLYEGLAVALLTIAPAALHAQASAIVGYPANFDAYNNTGAPTYGFEIEADGINANDVTRVFPAAAPPGTCLIRYCYGTVVPFTGGVYIRWMSPYDPATNTFTISTPVTNGTVASGESCWTSGLGGRYPAAGCEHFGISTARNPSKIIYRWLVPDPNNPGQLTYYNGNPLPGATPPPPIPVPIPQPVINLVPAAGGGQVVDFAIPAPAPPQPALFGPAQWVKVYKLELPNEVDLNDLMGGNPVVPEDPAQAELPWTLLQSNPHSANSGVLHNQAVLGNGSHAVVRRYEHYEYTGTFDPVTHEALCAVADCASPGPGELGQIIGAQNAAANIETASLTVVKVGSGVVTGGGLNCGGVCTATVNAGTSETITAQAPSNGVFNGWTGACTGTTAGCTVTVNGALTTTATFTTVYTLSASRSGNGTVTGTPDGEFGTSIDCGSSCSAKFQQGATVTLTATPSGTAKFTGWSGACSGTAPTCVVTINADTKAQASFK